MASTTKTPRARALGAELREARETAGMGVRELARKLGQDHSVVSRWESGDRLPRVEDVGTLLMALGVNLAERERLMEMARDAADPNWVTSGVPVHEKLSALIEFERTAKHITDVSPLLVPGLLQSADYARAIMVGSRVPRGEVETRIAVRLGRRDILTRRKSVPLVALVGESALRNLVGSPEIMVDQLQLMIDLSALPSVTVQVVCSKAGFNSLLEGPFVLFEFAKGKPIVHLEHHRAALFLQNERDVADFGAAAAAIREIALDPAESVEFIADVMHDWRGK